MSDNGHGQFRDIHADGTLDGSPPVPCQVEVISPDRPAWKTSKVTIYDGDQPIGAYERNYAPFSADTFEPFLWNGAWYALYSPDYTGTRIMTLPDCRDIGGEAYDAHGFCPVELYVPRYRVVRSIWPDASEVPGALYWWFESEAERYPEGLSDELFGGKTIHYDASPWQTLGTAFIAGCHWGDDTSWKLQTIDLSRVAEGIITRKPTFGFVELGPLPLVKAVHLHHDDRYGVRATIIRREDRDLATGALIDPYE